MSNNPRPLILAFVSDLYFAVRIESAAEQAGYQARFIETAEQIAPDDLRAPKRQLAEHLHGRGAALIDQITLDRPALLIFDLNNANVPWPEWIALIKSAPATRRLPVICFCAHRETEKFTTAQGAGADAVLARSRFVEHLPELLSKYARQPDNAGLQMACQESLSEKAVEGLELFNRGEYFEAHEILEEAWNADGGPGKELYRAILQVAVAYLQIERRNFPGAMKMFLRMRQWIDPLPVICRGIDVNQLREDAQAVYQALKEGGEENIAAFDRTLFKPVKFAQE